MRRRPKVRVARRFCANDAVSDVKARGNMVQQSSGPLHPAEAASPGRPPVLADTLEALQPFNLHLGVVSAPAAQSDWLDEAALALPQDGALAHLLHAFKVQGVGPNRKAASASLLLRMGWAGGFAIGAYLVCRRVPMLHAYAVSFSRALLLQAIWVRDVRFAGAPDDPLSGAPGWIGSEEASELRRLLVQSLVAFTAPVVASQHAWSGLSRHALWAMATSSWAEQFTNVARQIGDESQGVREARALFDLVPELQRAAPALYAVQGGGNARICQRRSACCLYFKNSARHFCASCPILPEPERLERNRVFVANQPAAERRPSQVRLPQAQ